MAVVNAVATRPYGAQDSRGLRIGATANAFPTITSAATPAECQPFAARNPFDVARDTSVSFAEGATPAFGGTGAPAGSANPGGSGGPTSTAIVLVRSAAKEALAAADFGYTDELASRCGQFALAIAEGSNATAYAVRMLPAPRIGERAVATLQTTDPRGPGDLGGTSLRVLAGTLSISVSLSVATDADAQHAVDAMADIARSIIDEAVKNPPTVGTPAPNSRTPEQLAGILQAIPGPDGSAPLVHAQLIPAAPSSMPPASSGPCTYSDEAYFGALTGSSAAQSQYSGTATKSYTTLQAVSMAGSVAQPYPFDVRAEALRTCTSITETQMGGGQSRAWSSIKPLGVTLAGDASYAVVYDLPDGTGEKHLLVGARRGTLSVEANDLRRSETEVQPAAEALAGLVNRVFAEAGL
jgi:hypothetical protein